MCQSGAYTWDLKLIITMPPDNSAKPSTDESESRQPSQNIGNRVRKSATESESRQPADFSVIDTFVLSHK